METWKYSCDLCGKEIAAYVRDKGILPEHVDCVNPGCEGVMQPFELTDEQPGYLLIDPKAEEMRQHRHLEEKKYRKRGFSRIECDMLYEIEQKKINAGMLILKEIEDW